MSDPSREIQTQTQVSPQGNNTSLTATARAPDQAEVTVSMSIPSHLQPPDLSDQAMLQRVLTSQNMTLEQFQKQPRSAQKNFLESERRQVKFEWKSRRHMEKQTFKHQQTLPLQIHGQCGPEIVDDNETVIDMAFVTNNESKDNADYARFKELFEDALALKHGLYGMEQIAQQYRTRVDVDDIRALEQDMNEQRSLLKAAVDEMIELREKYVEQCRSRYQAYQEIAPQISTVYSSNFRDHTARKIEILRERVESMGRDLAQVVPMGSLSVAAQPPKA